MFLWLPLLVLQAAPVPPPASAEGRVVEYLKANVKPGQRVVVSQLYNDVFTTPDERAALNRLFNTFFKIPLFVAQFQRASGRPPSLREIGEQFGFELPGQTDVMLRIMESDPRMPKFLERDPAGGEIRKVDVDAIQAHPRFGKLLERTIAGFEGRPAPAFETTAFDGARFDSAALAGQPHAVYFWFSGCPPCVKTSPLLAELQRAHARAGFAVVAANADRLLELPVSDGEREAYVKKARLPFTLVHASQAMLEAYGSVSVYPTLFFVDRKGTIVKQLVNAHEKADLEQALAPALQ
jgi:thiol-disulfide isomerase/thioredoxin